MRNKISKLAQIYNVEDFGFDMMGYTFESLKDLSYHHLLVPKFYGGPMSVWNGALLNRSTSHDYLHAIEKVDPETFYKITYELTEEMMLREIRIANLVRIRELLLEFENNHGNDRILGGKRLIRREFLTKRIPL